MRSLTLLFNVDDRAIGTILDALTARGFKAELRNWVSQEWWRTSLFSFKVYQKFFLACCKLDDIELALREFERLAVQLDRGGSFHSRFIFFVGSFSDHKNKPKYSY